MHWNTDARNNDDGNNVAFIRQGEENIVAICTPLMKRIHANIRQSAELVFMDSTGCLDISGYRGGSRIFGRNVMNAVRNLPSPASEIREEGLFYWWKEILLEPSF